MESRREILSAAFFCVFETRRRRDSLPPMLSMRRFPIWIIACLCFGSRMLAQSYPVPAVTFSGDPAFSSTELLAAGGLAIGASMDQGAMQAAAQRLNDSGMFATVR